MGTVLVFALFLQSGLGQELFHSDGLIAPLRIMKSTCFLLRNMQEDTAFCQQSQGVYRYPSHGLQFEKPWSPVPDKMTK